MKATAKAHTNIALIKYWGKRDDQLILPMNNSLSLTLDGFYTETTVDFQSDLPQDVFHLNDELVTGEAYNRVTQFMDLIRNRFDHPHLYADVHSTNAVPTAAGFASSASGFAALAGAAVRALGESVNQEALSRLTRRGSGSACRSIYGGFVEWQKGEKSDGSDSFAVEIAPADHWDVRIAAVVLDSAEKKIPSRAGMKRTVDTSAFYQGWLDRIPQDLEAIKSGIQERDFEKVGMITEANCLRMHATTMGSNPPFTYWNHLTMRVMETVQNMRSNGIYAYFTIDAGPNVKVLYTSEHEALVEQTLQAIPGVADVILSRTGEGVTYPT